MDIKYSKGQMRIQQMAFMLVALVIFFAMVGMVYLSISLSGMKQDVEKLRIKEAAETVKKMAASPELAFTAAGGCTSCVDMDRAIALMNDPNYKDLWNNVNYLMIEKIYPPSRSSDCNLGTYPDCRELTLIKKGGTINAKTAFVTLVRWDPDLNINAGGGGYRYELGRIQVSTTNKTQ